jgi:hypothetical protein
MSSSLVITCSRWYRWHARAGGMLKARCAELFAAG